MEFREYENLYKTEKNHWWFKAKRKYLRIALQKTFGKRTDLKILDLGCGTGAVMEFLSSKGYGVIGLDFNEEALKYCAEKGLRAEKGSAEKINFPNNSFDVVLSFDLLEHLDNPEKAVEEAGRVLKNGGALIATVPAYQWLWSYHDENLHHRKRYYKKDFRVLFEKRLSLDLISYIHFLPLVPAASYRFINKIIGRTSESDVQESGKIISSIMGFFYFFELLFFKAFKFLPFGLSLMAIARKK